MTGIRVGVSNSSHSRANRIAGGQSGQQIDIVRDRASLGFNCGCYAALLRLGQNALAVKPRHNAFGMPIVFVAANRETNAMSSMRPQAKSAQLETANVLCPVCFAVVDQPCRKVRGMNARKVLSLGEPLLRIHDQRREHATAEAARTADAETLVAEGIERLAARFPGANRR